MHRVDVVLRPGDPPCTLTFEGEEFEDQRAKFLVTTVSRLATESSGACAAGVLYDLGQEKRARQDPPPPTPLEAGMFLKPGYQRPPDFGSPDWNLISDLNFDGYADLCVAEATGAHHYFQRCWLFDPVKRAFVREPSLDPLVFVKIDAQKKMLQSTRFAGGDVYVHTEYAWIDSRLTMVLEETTRPNRPDGKPLPKGFTQWMRRRALRGGELVTVFDGPDRGVPERDKQ